MSDCVCEQTNDTVNDTVSYVVWIDVDYTPVHIVLLLLGTGLITFIVAFLIAMTIRGMYKKQISPDFDHNIPLTPAQKLMEAKKEQARQRLTSRAYSYERYITNDLDAAMLFHDASVDNKAKKSDRHMLNAYTSMQRTGPSSQQMSPKHSPFESVYYQVKAMKQMKKYANINQNKISSISQLVSNGNTVRARLPSKDFVLDDELKD